MMIKIILIITGVACSYFIFEFFGGTATPAKQAERVDVNQKYVANESSSRNQLNLSDAAATNEMTANAAAKDALPTCTSVNPFASGSVKCKASNLQSNYSPWITNPVPIDELLRQVDELLAKEPQSPIASV
jgi:hypothetical protein